MHTHVYVCVYIYVCIYTYICIHGYTHICIYTGVPAMQGVSALTTTLTKMSKALSHSDSPNEFARLRSMLTSDELETMNYMLCLVSCTEAKAESPPPEEPSEPLKQHGAGRTRRWLTCLHPRKLNRQRLSFLRLRLSSDSSCATALLLFLFPFIGAWLYG